MKSELINTHNRGAEMGTNNNTRSRIQSQRHSRVPNASSTETGAERAANQPGGLNWPELRIGRQASLDTNIGSRAYSETNDSWNVYLNELARRNRKFGEVLTLGAVACHYITDKDMRNMILRQRPKYKEDLKSARKYYYEISDNLRGFLKAMGVEYDQLDINTNQSGNYSEAASDSLYVPKSSTGLLHNDALMKLRDGNYALTGYDSNKIGIDLSKNTGLYDERREILSHLKSDLKFDISDVRLDWEPHAVIFVAKPHLTNEQLSTINFPHEKDVQLPRSMIFESPKVDFSR